MWIQENYPHLQLIPVSSTALGAQRASTDFESASISNFVCAELYGLELLEDKLAPSENTTRFLLFERGLFEKVNNLGEFRKGEYATLIFHEPKLNQDGMGIQSCPSSMPIHRIFSKPVPRHLNIPNSSLWYVDKVCCAER